MTDKEALECVKKAISDYKRLIKHNLLDEIIGNSVYYGSSLSMAYFYSLFNSENKYKMLPYSIAFLVSSLICLKKHNGEDSIDEDKKILKNLKSLKKQIIFGHNPLENVEKDEFNKSLVKIQYEKFN